MRNWEFDGYMTRLNRIIERKRRDSKPNNSVIAIRLDFAEALIKEFTWIKRNHGLIHTISHLSQGQMDPINSEGLG